jgi:hypothetical protein
MTQLILQSYLWLIVVGATMRFGTIRAVHKMATASKTRPQMHGQRYTSDALCHAMDLACAFYPKRVLCLQRSAATLLLLRRHGWNAELVIGAQTTPFKSHAWVELNGAVVSDKPYMREMYQVLELL